VKIELLEDSEVDDAIIELGISTIWATSEWTKKQTVDIPLSSFSISTAVQTVLTDQNLSWELLNSGIYRLNIESDEQRWVTLIYPDEEHKICVMTSVLPVNVPESHRASVVMELAAPNYEMGVGSLPAWRWQRWRGGDVLTNMATHFYVWHQRLWQGYGVFQMMLWRKV